MSEDFEKYLGEIKGEHKKFKRVVYLVITILTTLTLGFVAKDIWMASSQETKLKTIADDLAIIKSSYATQHQLDTYISYISDFKLMQIEVNKDQKEYNDKADDKYIEIMKKLYQLEIKYASQVNRTRGYNNNDTILYKTYKP